MVVKNVGQALRYCIPQMVGKKIGEFWVMQNDTLFVKVLSYRLNKTMCIIGAHQASDRLQVRGYRDAHEQHVRTRHPGRD